MIKPGFHFTNNDTELTVVSIHQAKNDNIALLVQNTSCPYLTVRSLSQEKNGSYTWAWGHYYDDIQLALQDYRKRLKSLSIE